MNDLNEWMEAWAPIRAGFEKLSLQSRPITLCCWANVDFDHNSLQRFPQLQSPGQSLQLGLVGAESQGSLDWCLLHREVAVEAQRNRDEKAKLFEQVEIANRLTEDFKNHADHAGNLLTECPLSEGVPLPQRVEDFIARRLWIEMLFMKADQPPSYQIKTVPYFPDWCRALQQCPPNGMHVLQTNPFAASVRLVDWARSYALIKQSSVEIRELAGAAQAYFKTDRVLSRRVEDQSPDSISKRQREIAQNPRPNRRAMTDDEKKKVVSWIRELADGTTITDAIIQVEARTSEAPPRGIGKTVSASTLKRAWNEANSDQ